MTVELFDHLGIAASSAHLRRNVYASGATSVFAYSSLSGASARLTATSYAPQASQCSNSAENSLRAAETLSAHIEYVFRLLKQASVFGVVSVTRYTRLTVCVFKFSMLDKPSFIKAFIIKFLTARFAFLRHLDKRVAEPVKAHSRDRGARLGNFAPIEIIGD